MSTDDVENTDGTNKGGDWLFANKPRTVPRGIKRMPQGTEEVFYIDQCIIIRGARGVMVMIGKTRFFSLGEATSLGEGKLWIQTC